MDSKRTPVLKLPLPHPDHLLSDDVLRLREAFTMLDAGFGTQRSEVNTALENTTQAVSDALNTLEAELNRKVRLMRLNQLLNLGI